MLDLGLTCVGGFVIVLGIALWLNTLLFLLRARKAVGTVVGHHTSQRRSGAMVAPIVQFQTADGQAIEFIDKVYGNPIVMVEGHSVKVAYDPHNPKRARINKFSTLHLIPIILIGVGVVVILAGLPEFSEPIMKFLNGAAKLLGALP